MYEDSHLATEAEAHAEWHRNSGVPMGTPGCPQDACHPDPEEWRDEPAEENDAPETVTIASLGFVAVPAAHLDTLVRAASRWAEYLWQDKHRRFVDEYDREQYHGEAATIGRAVDEITEIIETR